VLKRNDLPERPQGLHSFSISVVIVAFESRQIIERAIESVVGCEEIICIDNASTDGLEGMLAGRQVVYVRNDENIGYPRACNRGAQIAKSEFILFMNPDVELSPGAIEALTGAINRYPGVDAFVPRTVTGDGTAWNRSTTKFENAQNPSAPRLRYDPVGDCCIRFVNGGVFLIRRSTFRTLGGFDENIFLYFEDDDLSLRLLAAGHKIVYVHNANAIHRVGTSSRPVGQYLLQKEFHKKRSEIYFNAKYGKKTNHQRELASGIAKIAFYCLTFRPRRVRAAYGRLRGAWSVRHGGDRP
jgi:GT2 family glycosyltransferase